MTGGEMWTQIGSSLAGLMFIWAMFKQYFPFEIEGHVQKYTQKLVSLFYPYIHITFHEFTTEGFYERSKAYTAIERYLSTNSSTRAKRLKADMVRDSKSLVLSMDDYEEIVDEFKGIKRKKKEEKDGEGDGKDLVSKKKNEDDEKSKESSKVTLSGLLNFIDGLWSACGGERIIVFTTNYVNKLDLALIRRGRMDKHIELSYCCFEAFKVLARNCLDLESHDLFESIGKLLEETKISPADVAENLMPKSNDEDADACLANLIDAIEKAKEEAKVNAEEEEKERVKAEEEKKAKAKKEEKDKEKEHKSDEAVEVEEKKTAGEQVKENGVKENGG
ncbi:hypothetical protein C3L33_18888, partial [Rhododendron williamsianum]